MVNKKITVKYTCTETVKYHIVPNLPNGLTLNEETGEISGSSPIYLFPTTFKIYAQKSNKGESISLTISSINFLNI